jgi:iron-sulfur cluster assembly protein
MIQLSEQAAKRVAKHIEKRGKGEGILIGVRTTGCSGLAYTLEYMDVAPITRNYMMYDCHGVKVWVSGKDLVYVDGMTVEWKRQGLNEGFDFINPKERDRCGCGESFRV